VTRRSPREALMVSVWAELGAGRITEDYIEDRQQFVDGYIEGGHITINPIAATVESCIHEILHRLHGEWGEAYVSNRTTYLLRRMTDAEIQQFYDEYQKRVKKKRRRRRATSVPPAGSGLGPAATESTPPAVPAVFRRATGGGSD
jgi:hypothetical protein